MNIAIIAAFVAVAVAVLMYNKYIQEKNKPRK